MPSTFLFWHLSEVFMSALYPAGPASVPADLTRPSPQYTRQAWLAVAALVLFMAAYLGLALWFVQVAVRAFLSLSEGSGDRLLPLLFAGTSCSLLALFMLKGLFFVRRGGDSADVEVTAAEQPELFEFLYRLADDAGAPRPHRVFLSPRVNAAVFYDISLLNLLLPSRKNLEIGLPLVNVLSLSELKAVLAHEFGHFAQRSMAVGSWVYISQQVASALIARRDWLDKLLSGISRIDLRVAWIGWLLRLVVWSIRSLLDSLLRVVVLAQRALSRQMEFQADLVAVSLTGSDELVHALHKLQAADEAWDRSWRFLHRQAERGQLPADVFAVHGLIRAKLAEIRGDQYWGRIPPAAGEEPAQRRLFKQGFAQPPQMWSTHPASFDREQNAKRRYLHAPHDARSAWLLFAGREGLQAAMRERIAGERPIERLLDTAATIDAVKAEFASPVFDPRYRGSYLGRELARHARNSAELIGAICGSPEVELAALYPDSLRQQVQRVEELEEELGSLRALREGVFKATGGRLVHRGREIGRRALPAAIREVEDELGSARESLRAHDRQCRAAHLAAAERLGGGWAEHLRGLIDLLHYAEHARADLADAHGLLGNVVAVVTADGKVSGGELKRLVKTCNQLHAVLQRVYTEAPGVRPDPAVLAKLGVESWEGGLEPLRLPAADRNNINDWMQVVDGWVHGALGALNALVSCSLEQLLASEAEVAAQLRGQAERRAAPGTSQVQTQYGLLLEGSERARQRRLGWWDRFQTADGLFADVIRSAVALAIVGGVVWAGATLDFQRLATLNLVNGLGTAVQVQIGKTQVALAAGAMREIELPLDETAEVVALAADGREIERFAPPALRPGERFIYNVAGATPLARVTASYGNADEVAPVVLGAPRWLQHSADFYFREPPDTVRLKRAKGATRSALLALAEQPPSVQLGVLNDPAERARLIELHRTWDTPEQAQAWAALASP
jgi:Zn-dependent protease with chaperone function